MEPFRGTTFEDDVSTLAFGGGEEGGGLWVAATWGGDAKVFHATGKNYVGTFFPGGRGVEEGRGNTSSSKSPILDAAFQPGGRERDGACAFGTLSGEVLYGASATRAAMNATTTTTTTTTTTRFDENEGGGMIKVVGTHDDAVKHVFFLEDKPDVVFSAGWDWRLNAWDLRMPSRSRKILSATLPFKPHVADAKNNRVLLVSSDGRERRYDSSVILLTNAPSFERTSRSFTSMEKEVEGGHYRHVRSCALSFNPKHSYGRNEKEQQQQQQQQPPCDFVLGLSDSKCSVEFFRQELDEKYAYNFLCHRETVRDAAAAAADELQFAFQRRRRQKTTATSTTQKKKQILLHPINGCAFIQKSKHLLVTGGGDGKLELWSTKTREHIETVCDFKTGSSIQALSTNDAGDCVAVAVTTTTTAAGHQQKTRKVYVKHFLPDETEEARRTM